MNSNPLSRIKLSQLRALVAVAEQGNFSEAALALEISQSAVSHAIAALEAELGVLLFSRGRQGAHLTPVGEQVMAHARQVLEHVEEMFKTAHLTRGLQGGQVRIASFRSVATHVLPKVIVQFQQQFPEIAVSVTDYDDYPGVEQALREGRADVGFTLFPTSKDFETWELFQDEYLALLPTTFEPQAEQLTWEELAAYPLIMHSDNVSCSLLIQDHCAAYGHVLKVGYRVRADSTMVGMVVQGLGAAILPRLAAEPIPAGVKVYSLPVPLFRVIGVTVLADALQIPAVFAFLEMLKANRLLLPGASATRLYSG